MDTNAKIEQLKAATCAYPIMGEDGKIIPCGKKQMMTCSLHLVSQMENGAIKLPFCDYHSFIAVGGHIAAKQETENRLSLHGPFELVHLIETVINAQVLSKKLQETLSALKDAEEEPK